MRIKVEQRHIERGRRYMVDGCPLALAISEATGKDVVVCITTAYFADGRAAALSKRAETFRERFDCDMHVEPFEFELGEPRWRQ